MSKNYILQTTPFRVPTNDGKLIEEHFGVATTGQTNVSIAHMVAPPGWSEPEQIPDFDEITILIQGRKLIEIDGEKVLLYAGQSILIKKGARIRYSNPFDQPNEYWSVCLPAFTIDSAHRVS